MKIFYFTSTGNSLQVARKIGGELLSIPKLLGQGKELGFKADKIGFVFPCYYLGLPRQVKEFLTKVKIESDYVFAVILCGKMSAGVLDIFSNEAELNGIKLSYLTDINGVDNYFSASEGKQIEEDEKKNIEEALKKMIAEIKSSVESVKRSGVAAGILSRVVSTITYPLQLINKDSDAADARPEASTQKSEPTAAPKAAVKKAAPKAAPKKAVKKAAPKAAVKKATPKAAPKKAVKKAAPKAAPKKAVKKAAPKASAKKTVKSKKK